MLKISNYIYFILIIIFSNSYVFTQSVEDLQKLKSEYEKYRKQQSQIQITDPSLIDIDPTTGLPRRAEVLPYAPKRSFAYEDSLDTNPQYFGYDFFTRRDTIAFWENLPTPANYLLGPGDELVISLWGETQLRETYTITRDGKIYDEKVGLLNLSGKTINKAREYLKSQYARIYSTLNGSPQSTFMDVSLGTLKSINVNFVGQVKYPGVYPVHPFSTVIIGLIQAGGVDTTGSLRQVQVKRAGEVKANIDLYDYLIKGDLASNIQLRDQDIIVVPPRLSVVRVDSAVMNKGIYESIPDETVYDLIQYAGGRTYDASETVGIRSIKPKKERRGIIYEAKYEDIEETKRILVKNGDEITVRHLFHELQEVELIGQVKVPGKYHYYKNMTFNDLLELGGGFDDSTFWKSVYHDQAEIIRRSPRKRYDKVISVDLTHIIEGKKDVLLQNLDRVVVHANSNFFEKKHVQILGEVNVPGSYPLISDNETLESIINRSGNLTSKAMKKGIAIYRDQKYFDIKAAKKVFISDNPNEEVLKLGKETKTKVRVAWQNTSIILMPGDSIVVKQSPGTVNVSGEVYNPGLIEFRTGKKLNYYLDAVGGLTDQGNKRGIIVIYTNGVVSPNKWYSTPEIEDGATIIVNKKPLLEPFNPTEFASTTLSLLSSLVTILVLSKQLSS